MKLDKDKGKAVVGTILTHLLIVLVLFFMALRTPLPLPEEEGIEVDLGNSMQGMGDTQTESQAPSQATENIEKNNANDKPNNKNAEDIITEDSEEAPAIAQTPKNDNKKEEKPKEPEETKEEKPQQKVNEKALFKGGNNNGNGNGTQQGGSEGITGQPGDQGSPGGLAGIKQYAGNGGSGNGPSYKLGNRKHKSLPTPSQDFTEECTVTVDIWVNKEGRVVRAEPATKGTTTSSKKMKDMAVDAALKSSFTADSEAADEQHGTITYNFVINH